MSNTKNESRILEGSIWDALILFALPIAFSNLLQILFNAADQAVVGRFAGGVALAAVGANAPVISLFVNAFSSCSVGANALIARRIGEGNTQYVNKIVHTALLFALSVGLSLLILGQFLAAPLLVVLGTPQEVLSAAQVYFRIYAAGFPFALLFNFGSAILRSIGDTKRPMIALASAGMVNVILNLILVVGFSMGVAGVAIATTVSNILSCMAVLYFLYMEEGMLQFRPSRLQIDLPSLKQILVIGGPAALQSGVFNIANICIQSGINSLGSATVAGSAIVSNIESMAYQLVNAFNQAATTFCGQNFGAGKTDRCKRIVKIALLEAAMGAAIFDISVVLFKYPIISIFTSEPAVIEAAVTKIMGLIALQYMITLYEISGACLRSMGRSLVPALLTIVGCVAFRVVWILTIFRVWHTFKVLIAVYPASWIVTASLTWAYYFYVRKELYATPRRDYDYVK